MTYVVNYIGEDEPLSYELRQIAEAIGELDSRVWPALSEEPSSASDGMLIYADGTNWDPGAGAGFYWRKNGEWIAIADHKNDLLSLVHFMEL